MWLQGYGNCVHLVQLEKNETEKKGGVNSQQFVCLDILPLSSCLSFLFHTLHCSFPAFWSPRCHERNTRSYPGLPAVTVNLCFPHLLSVQHPMHWRTLTILQNSLTWDSCYFWNIEVCYLPQMKSNCTQVYKQAKKSQLHCSKTDFPLSVVYYGSPSLKAALHTTVDIRATISQRAEVFVSCPQLWPWCDTSLTSQECKHTHTHVSRETWLWLVKKTTQPRTGGQWGNGS